MRRPVPLERSLLVGDDEPSFIEKDGDDYRETRRPLDGRDFRVDRLCQTQAPLRTGVVSRELDTLAPPTLRHRRPSVRGPWPRTRRSSPLAAGKRNSSPHSLTTERGIAPVPVELRVVAAARSDSYATFFSDATVAATGEAGRRGRVIGPDTGYSLFHEVMSCCPCSAGSARSLQGFLWRNANPLEG
jgi:hypothetical protein